MQNFNRKKYSLIKNFQSNEINSFSGKNKPSLSFQKNIKYFFFDSLKIRKLIQSPIQEEILIRKKTSILIQ